MHKIPKISWFGLALFVCAFLLWIIFLLFNHGYVGFNHPNVSRFPIRGIDISHHQGDIEWAKLQNANVRFIYIKATEGGDFIDPRYAQNWQSACGGGWLCGAYHFFTFCSKGKTQADHFIATVLPGATLPPAVDVEFGGNCKNRPDDASIVRELQIMLDTLEQHFGQKPVLYATNKAYR